MRHHVVEGEELAGKFSMFREGPALSSATITSAGTARATPTGSRAPDPPGRPPHCRGRRLRRHDVRPAVSQGFAARDRGHGAAPLCRHAVRSRRSCRRSSRRWTRVRGRGDGAHAGALQQLQPWQPNDIIAELSHGRDDAALGGAGFTLSRLLDVPSCDVYRLDEDADLVCFASVREGEWYPEHLGKVADVSPRATPPGDDRHALADAHLLARRIRASTAGSAPRCFAGMKSPKRYCR